MNQYERLAPFYDSLTQDVDYEDIADYYEDVFEKYGVKPKMLLDLACGTGTLTWLLAGRGYEMIGVDLSSEMLAEAMQKGGNEDVPIKPVFINQPLEELDLYGTVEAAVCCLDGINYIPEDKITEVFRRLNLFIEPGGVLIFDINSPKKLREMDGQMFIDETDDVYCVWRAEFDETENCCFYGMDIFVSDGDNKWDRLFEEHLEYLYEPKHLAKLLEMCGFKDIGIYGERSFDPPDENEERIYITARNTR